MIYFLVTDFDFCFCLLSDSGQYIFIQHVTHDPVLPSLPIYCWHSHNHVFSTAASDSAFQGFRFILWKCKKRVEKFCHKQTRLHKAETEAGRQAGFRQVDLFSPKLKTRRSNPVCEGLERQRAAGETHRSSLTGRGEWDSQNKTEKKNKQNKTLRTRQNRN